MDDIQSLTSLPAPSAPDVAAKNINNANLFGVDPSSYKSLAPDMDPKADALNAPHQATPAVTDFMKQSTEHAALATPDVPHLNFMEEAAKYAGDIIYNRPTDAQKVINLNLKKLDHPDKWTDDDDLQLIGLNADQAKLQETNYGTDGPSLPQQIGQGIADTGRSLRRNADLIGAFTGVGAGAGFVFGGVGALPGAATGFGLGVTSAFAIDAYDSARGSVYNELSNITKPDGTPMNIDDHTKRYISNGLGVVSAALMGTVGKAVTKSTPFLNKFVSPALAKNLISNPMNAAIAKSVMNIGEAVAAGGGAGGLMETAHIIATEMGNTYDGSEASFLNALQAAGNKIGENSKRVAQAMVVGGAQAGILSIGTNIAGFKSTYHDFEQRSNAAFEYMRQRAGNVRDVTPPIQERIPGPRAPNPDQPIDVTPQAPGGSPLKLLNGGGEPRDTVRESINVLHLQDAIESVNHGGDQTKMNELSPHQMDTLKGSIFANAGMKKVFLLPADLRDWANSEKKGEAARQLIDSSGVAKAQMNAPIEVDPHKFAGFVSKNPDASDLVRMTPDGPSAAQARAHLTAMQDADAQRIQILTKLGIDPAELVPKPEEKPSNVTELPAKGETIPFDLEGNVRRADAILAHLDNPENTPAVTKKLNAELESIKTAVKGHYMKEPGKLIVADWGLSDKQVADQKESEFMSEPVYTKVLETIIPKAEMERFSTAVMSGKKAIQDDINFALQHEMMKVHDVVKLMADETSLEEAKALIENDPRYAIVDKFRDSRTVDAKGKKGKSVYAIDPRTLRDDQLHYTDHPRLKEHGVWAKPGEGNSPDKAAQLIGGVVDGDDLLKTLAGTPTRMQINQARGDFMKAQNQRDALESVDFNYTNKLKSYDNRATLTYQLMKYMREKEWPATKQAIKRLAFPPPQPKEIAQKAYQLTLKTKVGDLDVQQYKIGEHQSRKIGITAILKMEPEKAHIALENQALNIQMQKHQLLAIGQVNKALQFATKFREKSTMATLAGAGKSYVKAATELLDVFNLDPSKKGTSERDSYMKWAQNELRKGRGDFNIPDKFADVRQSVNDMTVEQTLLVVNRLRAVLNAARLKNKLLKKYLKAGEIETMETIRTDIENKLLAHPGYNINRIPEVQETKSTWRHMGNFVQGVEALFTNMDHILRQLDEGKLGGMFQELLYHGLKGDGKFDKKAGYTRELELTKAFREHHDKLVEKYGQKDFQKVERKILKIPEFANVKELNHGELTKGDLFTLWAHGGDAYLKQKRFENNGGVGHDIMQKVFDRELEPRDVDYVQAVVDMYKDYRTETEALQKRTTGQEVTFVEGIPNRHRDRVLSGGYLPAKYRIDYTIEGADQALKVLEGNKAAWFERPPQRQFAAEQTEQGRLITREGSDKALDLSWMRVLRGHEEVIHDLSYRETSMDALKILKDKKNREHMIATVGVQKYNLLVNTVIEIATKAEAENANYFADQTRLWKVMYGHLKNNFNTTVLAMNPTSTLIQFESTTQTLMNMGLQGVKHYGIVNAKMMARPDLWAGFYNFASELDPTIGHFLEGLQNKLTSNVMEIAPKKGMPIVSSMKDIHTKMISGLMAPMQIMDVFIKVQAALSSYSQFMAGDVADFPSEVVKAMPEKEQHERAQAYVRQISRLSLTHGRPEDRAPFQKNPGADMLANYWNDARNVLNNQLSQGRRVGWEMSKAKDALAGGSGGSEPPKKPPTNALGETSNPFEREGINDRYKVEDPHERDWKAAGAAIKGAAGIALATMTYAMIARMYSDWLRGNQATPLDENFDFKSAKGVADFGGYMASYMLMSPPDQLMMSTPIARQVGWSAQNIWEKSKTKRVDLPITKTMSDFATTVAYLSDFLQMGVGPTQAQVRAMLDTESYLMVPIPVNGFYKLRKFFDGMDLQSHQKSTGDRLKQQIHDWNELHVGDPSKKDFVAQLDKIDVQLGPKSEAIPDGTADSIKYAESEGKWSSATPNVYGFTEDQWSHMTKAAPELGLTEKGRVSKDSLQQDLAMDWALHDNARQLSEKHLQVNESSLYAVHKLGIDNFEKLSKAPADAKIKSVFGPDVFDKFPEFAEFKTVGQVRNYLNRKMNEGRRAVEGGNKLTSPTANNED